MGKPLRVLIVSSSSSERARLESLVRDAGLEEISTESQPLDRAATAIGRRDVDLLLTSGSDGAALGPLFEAVLGGPERLPVVIVAVELSRELSLLANRHGARVCLFDHGPEPLALAIASAARQETPDATERVRALVQSSVSDVVFNLRVEGDDFRFVEVNPAFSKATGLGADQIVGRLVTEVIPEPSSSLVLTKYRQAIAERRTVRWEEITPYPAGRKIGEVSVTPVLDAQGRTTHLVGTVQDVTAVREHAETIRLYADIVRNVQIGLTVWNVPEPDDSTKITLAACNPAAAELSGIDLASRIGCPFSEVYSYDQAELLLGFVRRVAREDAVFDFSAVQRPNDSRVFSLKGFPLPGACVGLAVEDVTAQARAYEQLRELSARIDAAREEERAGIARELHDELGQALTVLKMDLAWLARRASSETGVAPQTLVEKLDSLMSMSDDMVEQVRRISSELRPAILDQIGLLAALTWNAREFAARTQIACAVESNLSDSERLDPSLSTAVFRVFQEALTNVARHSEAARVQVRLELGDPWLVLEVRDDGRGITEAEIADPRSLGLLGMRERARRLGGTLAFTQAAPRGTLLTLKVPLRAH